MSLAAIAALVTGARPFHLYFFQRGAVQYQYTSTAQAITRTIAGADSTTWTPSAISHGKIPDSDQAFRSELTVAVPLSSDLAGDVVGAFDYTPVILTIYRGDTNSSEVIPVFKGRVLSATPQENGTCNLSCMTEIAALQRKGLAAVIQRPCRHVHYGRGCGLSLSAFQVASDITSISASGKTVTLASASAQPDGFYRLGILEWGGRFEMMLTHVGNVVTLSGAIPGLVAAVADNVVSVNIAPGCPLSRTVCNDRFNNILNFGGFPFISDNPFDGRQVF